MVIISIVVIFIELASEESAQRRWFCHDVFLGIRWEASQRTRATPGLCPGG